MAVQIVTTEDLHTFKIELINEIKQILNEKTNAPKKWLKSSEVRKMLNISTGTLQTLRVNGSLPCTKVGGTNYFSLSDIELLMKNDK